MSDAVLAVDHRIEDVVDVLGVIALSHRHNTEEFPLQHTARKFQRRGIPVDPRSVCFRDSTIFGQSLEVPSYSQCGIPRMDAAFTFVKGSGPVWIPIR